LLESDFNKGVKQISLNEIRVGKIYFLAYMIMNTTRIWRCTILISDISTLFFIDENDKEKIDTTKRFFNEMWEGSKKYNDRENCICCEKEIIKRPANSHSIPRSVLKNIKSKCGDGRVMTFASLSYGYSIHKSEHGIKKEAGTFEILCNECEAIRLDYENLPLNCINDLTHKMMLEIVGKNLLQRISQLEGTLALYRSGLDIIITEGNNIYNSICNETSPNIEEAEARLLHLSGVRCMFKLQIQQETHDLHKYTSRYHALKGSINDDKEKKYGCFFFEKLDYIVPFAFQSSIVVDCDFEGNVIYYPKDTDDDKSEIHLCVFPYKTHSIVMIIMEEEARAKRYDNFKKQFTSLDLENKLSAICFLIFRYSDRAYMSKDAIEEIRKNEKIRELQSYTSILIQNGNDENAYEKVIKERGDLAQRQEVPNLLTRKYSL